MNVDVIGSLLIYTVATVAFYLLGAGILNKMGLVPDGATMIATLTNIYTETLGGWSRWLFYAGALVILFGTIVAMTAGHSRMFADFMRLQGVFADTDYRARVRWRDIFIVVLLVIPVGVYAMLGEAPVQMVVWGATGQAVMLPVLAFATVLLVHRHLPRELAAPRWMTALLWFGAVVITAFVVPALLASA
jgi:Mn2+/Fe2+ NRAMP family transporter